MSEETSRRYFKLRKCVFSDIREKKKELLKLEVRTEKRFLSQMTGFVGHKEWRRSRKQCGRVES